MRHDLDQGPLTRVCWGCGEGSENEQQTEDGFQAPGIWACLFLLSAWRAIRLPGALCFALSAARLLAGKEGWVESLVWKQKWAWMVVGCVSGVGRRGVYPVRNVYWYW